MTLQQVAEYLQVHVMTLYRWAKKGAIPAFKVGNRWRFKRTQIDEFFKLNAQEA
jgi:excisionase family DNA binding protein